MILKMAVIPLRINYYVVLELDLPQASGWYRQIEVSKIPDCIIRMNEPHQAYRFDSHWYLLLTIQSAHIVQCRICDSRINGPSLDVSEQLIDLKISGSMFPPLRIDGRGFIAQQHFNAQLAVQVHQNLHSRSRATINNLRAEIENISSRWSEQNQELVLAWSSCNESMISLQHNQMMSISSTNHDQAIVIVVLIVTWECKNAFAHCLTSMFFVSTHERDTPLEADKQQRFLFARS